MSGHKHQANNVILVADRLEAIKAELQGKYKVRVHVATVDVSDLAAVSALPESLPKEFSQVDILVNNAGALNIPPCKSGSELGR